MSIPAVDLDLMRSAPQASDVYLVIQQPQYKSTAEYVADEDWIGAVWYAQVNGVPSGDPLISITVDNGMAANVSLLDGMTVFIGSSFGLWDRGMVRLRRDQNVTGATTSLTIAASSDLVGRIYDNDWIVVLDEFRLWQVNGRVTAAGSTITWYKDYNILWTDLGAADAGRRLAASPPVPVMGPPAVKFVDTPSVTSRFYFDWSNSYATAVGETVATWTSTGEQDHAGNTWSSAAEVPGWQTTLGISGLRGFRVTLAVDDGNGNSVTLPFRRGVRYVFTLRKPGQSQPGDPPDAEPITEFRINSLSGSFEQGYWSANITLYGDAADYYTIIPGTMVILFTEDWYTSDAPYMDPTALRKVSIGPVYDRENILMVGYIADASIQHSPETGEVTFEVRSVAQEAETYEAYSIPIEDNSTADDWRFTPSLNVDRAAWHYVCWHSTLARIADFYWADDSHAIKGMDFAAGPIYRQLSSFYWDRLRAMPLCDKYGRIITEIDAQVLPFGSVETLWVMAGQDWLEDISIRRFEQAVCKAAECGGLFYDGDDIVPYLSRAPGVYDKYRGSARQMNSLAIDSQTELNAFSGRLLNGLNHTYELDISLAGNWHWLDIVPQAAVYMDALDTERGTITGRTLIRTVSVTHLPEVGALMYKIYVEQEMADTPPGVTVDIPEELPVPSRRYPDIPAIPGLPPLIDTPATDTGRRIIATDKGVYYTNGITATTPVWYSSNTGFVTANDKWVHSIARDPFHWWTSGGTERTLWALTRTGVWKQENFPSGTWVQQISTAAMLTALGFGGATTYNLSGTIDMSIETEGRYALGVNLADWRGVPAGEHWQCCTIVCQDAAISNSTELPGYSARALQGWHYIKFNSSSGAQIIYSNPSNNPFNVGFSKRELFRTVNGGGAWASLDGPYTHPDINFWGGLSVPYWDLGSSVLWSSGATKRISTNGGASFANVTGAGATDMSFLGTFMYDDRMWLGATRPDGVQCKWSITQGASWTNVPFTPLAFQPWCYWTMWNGASLVNVMAGGYEAGVTPVGTLKVYYHNIGDASWSNKTGNLVTSFSVGYVYDIDRDSMGSA